MRPTLTLQEFRLLAQHSSIIAVFEEIPMSDKTPVMIYQLLQKLYYQEGVLFEDLYPGHEERYAYLSFEVMATLSIHQDDGLDPIIELRKLQAQYQPSTRQDVSHLISNIFGFMSYDVVHFFENIPHQQQMGDQTLPLCLFNFYALNLTFDYQQQTILISTIVDVNQHEVEVSYRKAREKIKNIKTLIANAETISSPPSLNGSNHTADTIALSVDTDDNIFMQMVDKAKEYIVSGDVFQIVISRSYQCNYFVTPFAIYETLREVSPAPYLFYFPCESSTIIGASPETLVKVNNQVVTVNPIAGTKKRDNLQSDETISADLLSDEKELAEHIMLVDLARNDVGAVSVPGSVCVQDLLKVKHYSHVSHITSIVSGQLKPFFDALDALKAAFPAGTLSGAPKIRAMEIINELEMTPRNLYAGAICRFDCANNFDSCIAIRMAHLKDGIATIRTGAGIVFDSVAKMEARETDQKAYSIIQTIFKAHGVSYDFNHR